MKKYLLGMSAVLLAVASVAFTAPKKNVSTGTYYFPINSSGHLQSYLKSDGIPYQTAQLGCMDANTPCEEASDDYIVVPEGASYRITPAGNELPGTESFKP